MNCGIALGNEAEISSQVSSPFVSNYCCLFSSELLLCDVSHYVREIPFLMLYSFAHRSSLTHVDSYKRTIALRQSLEALGRFHKAPETHHQTEISVLP